MGLVCPPDSNLVGKRYDRCFCLGLTSPTDKDKLPEEACDQECFDVEQLPCGGDRGVSFYRTQGGLQEKTVHYFLKLQMEYIWITLIKALNEHNLHLRDRQGE